MNQRKVTDEMRQEEPFRWCVHCDADCEDPGVEHTPSCPQSTGVYHVRYEAMHAPCEHCGKRPDPSIHCAECDCVLALGDPYTHKQTATVDGTPLYEPVCLGCAANEATSW